MTHGRVEPAITVTVLSDFSLDKLTQAEHLYEFIHGLSDTDVLRVMGQATHELLHRKPELLIEDVTREQVEAIAYVHTLGLP